MTQINEELKKYIDQKFETLKTEIKNELKTEIKNEMTVIIKNEMTVIIKNELAAIRIDLSTLKNNSTLVYGPKCWKKFICCEKKCSEDDEFVGYCRSNNGFPKVQVSEENYPCSIEYIFSKDGPAFDKLETVYAKNKIQIDAGKNFFYEVTVTLKDNHEQNKICMGLTNSLLSVSLELEKKGDCSAYLELFIAEHHTVRIYLNNLSFNNDDVFGTAIFFPPINSTNRIPYVFFTKNESRISKALLLDVKLDKLKSFVSLQAVSISKTNFGQDLIHWPFCYQDSNTELEFYTEDDFQYYDSSDSLMDL